MKISKPILLTVSFLPTTTSFEKFEKETKKSGFLFSSHSSRQKTLETFAQSSAPSSYLRAAVEKSLSSLLRVSCHSSQFTSKAKSLIKVFFVCLFVFYRGCADRVGDLILHSNKSVEVYCFPWRNYGQSSPRPPIWSASRCSKNATCK